MGYFWVLIDGSVLYIIINPKNTCNNDIKPMILLA